MDDSVSIHDTSCGIEIDFVFLVEILKDAGSLANNRFRTQKTLLL